MTNKFNMNSSNFKTYIISNNNLNNKLKSQHNFGLFFLELISGEKIGR